MNIGSITIDSFRDDIELYPGTRGSEGLPTYVLHDRWRNKFVNVGWLEYEIIKRLNLNDPAVIANAVCEETTLYAIPEDVIALKDFLQKQELTINPNDSKAIMARGAQIVEAKKKKRIKWNPMGYLMFRIPLVRPDKFLESTMWMIRPFMTKTALYVNLMLLMLGAILVLQQWHSFLSYVDRALSLDGAVYLFFALAISKSLHEFGHAYTCKRFGLKVSSMGLMWMMIFPFLYTDTTESWKLESRKKRIAIGSAGVMAEMQLAVIATLLWAVLPDSSLRYACFYLATAAWVATLVINLSPFLRWDGYWVLSDIVGIQNMRERANKITQWWFGRMIMGFETPNPVILPEQKVRFCIGFSILAWFYRIGIFIAIGALIFTRVPKILGIYAVATMILAMVIKPIFGSIWVYFKRRDELRWNRYSISSFAVMGLVLLVLFIPWQSTIETPGVIAPRLHNEVYPGVEGKVIELAKVGSRVSKGDYLFKMENQDLAYEQQIQKNNIDYYSTALARIGSRQLLEFRALDRSRLNVANSEYVKVSRNVSRLQGRAPYDGVVTWVDKTAEQGGYVSTQTPLLTFIDPNSNQIYGYIGEYDLQRLNQQGQVRFYPEHPYFDTVDGHIEELDTANAAILDYEILASTNSGPITVERDSETGKLVPRDSIYLVRIKIDDDQQKDFPILIRGRVVFEGERKSFASRFFDSLVGTVVRESGF